MGTSATVWLIRCPLNTGFTVFDWEAKQLFRKWSLMGGGLLCEVAMWELTYVIMSFYSLLLKACFLSRTSSSNSKLNYLLGLFLRKTNSEENYFKFLSSIMGKPLWKKTMLKWHFLPTVYSVLFKEDRWQTAVARNI